MEVWWVKMMKQNFNKALLYGNSNLNEVIKTETRNGAPVPGILKNPPKLLERLATTNYFSPETKKETNANNFPDIRGVV
jgi:hypothetical protein